MRKKDTNNPVELVQYGNLKGVYTATSTSYIGERADIGILTKNISLSSNKNRKVKPFSTWIVKEG